MVQNLSPKQIAPRSQVQETPSRIQPTKIPKCPNLSNTHTDTKGRVTKKYRLGTAQEK